MFNLYLLLFFLHVFIVIGLFKGATFIKTKWNIKTNH